MLRVFNDAFIGNYLGIYKVETIQVVQCSTRREPNNYTYETWCYTLYILFYSTVLQGQLYTRDLVLHFVHLVLQYCFVRAYLGNKMQNDVVEGYIQFMHVRARAEALTHHA